MLEAEDGELVPLISEMVDPTDEDGEPGRM